MFITWKLQKVVLNKCHLRRIKRTFSNKEYTQYNPLLDYTLTLAEKTILLVGDGDLSNGAAMAKGIHNNRSDVKIVASVLESEGAHNDGE